MSDVTPAGISKATNVGMNAGTRAGVCVAASDTPSDTPRDTPSDTPRDTHSDARFMALALSLGQRGLGNVWPNPAVGCVFVQTLQGRPRIVGRGWTQPGGRPHAEVVALAQAGDAARGATAYVTLEPCSHTGQTGPCAEALIAAGVTRVVVALQDPDLRVAGRGLARLRAAGLIVDVGVGAAQAAIDQRGFLLRVTQGRPMVTLKLAASLDGRIATASGESQWITGPAARRLGHALRARHDAVLVGAGTAREDDPTLTVRDLGVARHPVRVVASRNLNLPLPSNLSRSIPAAPYWVVHGPGAGGSRRAAFSNAGVRLVEAGDARDSQIDPVVLLQALGAQGLTRVYCEGGGAMAAALLAADVVDDVVMMSAGLGLGAEGRPALGVMGLASLAEAQRFALIDVQDVGGDVVSTWRRPVPGL